MPDDLYDRFLKARLGTPGAIDAFLLRSSRVVDRWCRQWQASLLERRRLVDDVVQESLFHVWRHFRTCRAGSDGELHAWIRRVAQNSAVDLLRRTYPEHRALVQIVRFESDTDHDLATAVADHEESSGDYHLQLVAEVCALLDRQTGPDVRHLLWLRLVGGHSWLEIGQELGVSWTAARRRYQRAIDRARTVLTCIIVRDAHASPAAAKLLRRLTGPDEISS